MIRPILRPLALLTALSATPLLADDAATAALTAAIEKAGCVVTNANGDAIAADAGLDDSQVFAAVADLYNAGLAQLEADGSMRLLTDACK